MKNASELEIGKVITGEQQRDAIHVAVAPVEAADVLLPGQHVSLLEGRAVRVPTGQKTVGVVDPYLTAPVKAGERFWLFLYPGSITSLRHEWAHPAFEGLRPDPALESRAWLEDVAKSVGYTYGRLMAAARDWVDSDGDAMTYDNTETYKDVFVPGKFDEFWRHYEAVTGRPLSENVKSYGLYGFFTCSCS